MAREEVRKAILEKFGEITSTLGLKRTTVDLLARKCGISKKTIYEHFKDKNELVRCSADMFLDQVRRQVNELDTNVADPMEKLNLLFDLSFELAASIPEILLHDIRQFYPEIQDELDGLIREISSFSVESLKKGQEMGIFKNINPNFIIAYVNGAANATLNSDCLINAGMTAEEAMSGFRELVLTGLIRTETF